MLFKSPEKEIRDILKLEKSVPHHYNNLGVFWRLPNGDLHREFGPAVEFASGYKEWYLNGKRHHENAPAVELSNGTKK